MTNVLTIEIWNEPIKNSGSRCISRFLMKCTQTYSHEKLKNNFICQLRIWVNVICSCYSIKRKSCPICISRKSSTHKFLWTESGIRLNVSFILKSITGPRKTLLCGTPSSCTWNLKSDPSNQTWRIQMVRKF